MSLRNHRIAAVSILVAGLIVVVVWGRSMAVGSESVQAMQARLQGAWVASLVQAGENRKVEGASAETCTVSFDGKSVRFRGLIGGIDTEGTYYLDLSKNPGWIDLKLEAGWIVGVFEVGDDSLKLCLNPFAPPERLGVPTIPRPSKFQSGEIRHLYVFRKATAAP